MQSSYIASIIVAALTLLGCLAAPDPLVMFMTGATLIAGLLLLWSKSSIPVLLLPFLLQWISVATKPIQSAIIGTPLPDLSDFGGDLSAAAIFALLALVALAFGMRAGMLGGDRNVLTRLQADVADWSDRGMLIAGLGLIGGGHVATACAYFVAGLSEIMLALANVTFCGLFMLVYWTLRTRKHGGIVFAVAIVEIVLGMTGFFGVFRTTLFTIALAVMCAQHRFKPQTVIATTLIVIPALFLTIFWSSVKGDYRLFLNNGSETQTVQQPMSARLDFLNDRAQHFDREQFDDGFTALVDRVSYIDFLSMTLEYVPSNVPHENGDRTFRAVTHIFTPRIIFTDKPALESDTEVTAKYTGLSFTNYTYASISIGYLGEAYIDFGWYGAIAFAFVYGAVMGLFVRLLLQYKRISMILNAGLALMVVIPICYFEQALIKTIGGATATLIAAFLLQRLAFPAILQNFAGRAGARSVPARAEQRYR